MAESRCRIGTCGYDYAHWRGCFYPKALPRSKWFSHYADHFEAVEIDNTFYRLPESHVFEDWRGSAPPGFCFALKFSRFATHYKHLLDPRETVALFVERARLLRDRLGPILVHLPPRWAPNPARLEAFFAALPQRLRWAIEFRDRRWLDDAVYSLLRRYRVALCVHDLVPKHPRVVTADFAYFRFHGDPVHGGYSPQFLAARARELESLLRREIDVYAFFNNDVRGYAVANALSLSRYLRSLSARKAKGSPVL